MAPKFLQQIDDGLALVERVAVCLLFLGLTLITFGLIVARNLFASSSQQLLELAPAGVLWIALLGASLALRQGRHIRLEVLLRFAPERVRRWAGAAASLFGAVIMGVLLAASFGFVENEVAIFGTRGWIAAIFPFFFIVAVFRYLLGVFRPLTKEESANRSQEGANG